MSRSLRHAFTLIEVLLSVAIAAVGLTLAISLFTTTSRTLGGQQKRISGGLKTVEAYTQLERDLLQTVMPMGSSNLFFRLKAPGPDSDFSRLDFASLRRLPGETDLRWTEVVLVSYFVNEEGELVRTAERDTGPPDLPDGPQVLLSKVTEFSVKALQSGESFEAWPQKDDAALPTGMELRLSVKDRKGEAMTGRILIPAGMVVQSSLERGSGPAALRTGGGL